MIGTFRAKPIGGVYGGSLRVRQRFVGARKMCSDDQGSGKAITVIMRTVTVRVLSSFTEAERADKSYYLSLTPA